MIKIIYGPKGTGKTKVMIDEANGKVAAAKGHLIFITNTKRYMYDLQRDIRVIDTSDYMIAGEEALCGFVKGVVAANNDNEYLFIDGAARSPAMYKGYGGFLLYARQTLRGQRADDLRHLQLCQRRSCRIRGKISVNRFRISALPG